MPVDDGLAKVMLLRGEFTLNYRALGRTGWKFRRSAFGAWADRWGREGCVGCGRHGGPAAGARCGLQLSGYSGCVWNGRSERRIAPLKQERSGEEIGGVCGAA